MKLLKFKSFCRICHEYKLCSVCGICKRCASYYSEWW